MLRWFWQADRRFGLAEAERSIALQHIANRADAQKVMGVLRDVVNFDVEVGPDVEQAVTSIQFNQSRRETTAESCREQIAALQQQIARLEAENVTATERMAELGSIAAMFQQ